MMKTTSVVLLIIAASVVAGRYDPIGDGLVNGTEHPVRCVVHTTDGTVLRRDLAAGVSGLERRELGKEGLRYQQIEAYGAAGKLIGEFKVATLPNRRGKYGRFHMFVVVDQGVYPVPAGLSGDEKQFKQIVIETYEREKAYEQRQLDHTAR
jgi:hypothetical protein